MYQLLKPYLSIVATSRNDNHGGDLTRRMRIFVRGLIHQANKFKLPCELIMVEWNPPKDQPLMHEVLPTPTESDFLKIRYVIVPHEHHITLKSSDWLPLFQMIAKNVGIRRAEGEFVLCTNIDLLFSDALFAFMAKQNLDPSVYYRCNRCDVPEDIDESLEMDAMLAWCEQNIQQRLGKNHRFRYLGNGNTFLFKHKQLYPLTTFLSWLKTKLVSEHQCKMDALDTWACGDFTMMTKDAWIKMQGYPELEMYSLHIDSMGLFAATASGLEQIILPADHCTYHISHYGGWELFDTPLDKLKFVANKHMLNWEAVGESGSYIVQEKIMYDINEPDWGLANTELEEIRIGYGSEG